ncbi:MAG TPA: hypothetical protein VNC50_03640, partial [Planctomycetia bacterium]|nr:hypothetical protein [Planctomycetia bacterium]
YITWGEGFYGKTDVVKGAFHFATRFFHLSYIPLIPMGGAVVLDKSLTEGEKTYLPVRFGFKSLALAYARAALMTGAIVFAIVAAINLTGDNGGVKRGKIRAARKASPETAMVAGAIAAGCLALWGASHLGMRASRSRALELAEQAGLSEEIVNHAYPEGDDLEIRRPRERTERAFSAAPTGERETEDKVYRLE